MPQVLTPTQEHYLKREFLKFQLAKELNDLNNRDALRRFGFPFTDKDPKLKPLKSTDNESFDSNERQQSIINTQFPLCSYILREFIMTFPLLSKNIEVDQTFWQEKVQIFFEHFMSLGFSDSYDREKLTKRKKIGLKLTKIILLLFNSGIGVSNEVEYYSNDKFQLNKDQFRKRSKVEEFAIPTMETLKQLVTQEPMYINDWDINIIGCVKESDIMKNKKWKKSQSVKKKSYSSTLSKSTQALTSGTIKSITSTSKWMKNTLTSTTTTSIFAKLSISANNGTSISNKPENNSHSSKSNRDINDHKYWFILKVRHKENPNEIIFTAKTYKDFKILSHNLKMESPGKKLPKLPEKTKQSLSLTTRNELLPNGRVPNQPREKIISSIETECETLNSTLNSTRNYVDDTNTNNNSLKQDTVLVNAQNIVNKIIENEGVNDGKDIDIAEDEDEDEDEDDDTDSIFEDASDTKTNTLVHEKMRTSLRQYLRRLSNDKETSENLIFVNFLSKENIIDGSKFVKEVEEDIKYRELVDINNLTNQLKFQKLALQKSLELQDSMKDFKSSLLKDEKYLLSLVNELRDKKCIEELSPLLQQFIEWFKIYLSSIIYQLFLGNDNSYGFYTQIRKLHRLMPYTMMGQIMKFTNPMSIMKGMIDLFLAQPFGNNSLLQTMFSTILTEDLKSQTSVIKKLETIILKESKNASQIIRVLKMFIEMDQLNQYHDGEGNSVHDLNNNDNLNNDEGNDARLNLNIERIHEESKTMDMPMCLIILMKYSEMKSINTEAVTEVLESYNGWKAKESNGLYFQHIKELFQLYIKERDKRLMRKLWQDPELSKLLKAMVTMVYEPMVKVFKIARMDIALKNFEKFMNDLIKLMDDIINGQLENSTEFNIIESIIQLVTKHQDSFYEFVHDVYLNDTEGIFEGFIKWITKIIRFLQCSKYGGINEGKRMDLNKLIIEKGPQIKLDIDTLKRQIDSVIEKKMKSRRLYRQLVESKIKPGNSLDKLNNNHKHNHYSGGTSKENINVQNFMDHRWKQVTSNIIPDQTMSFGLQDGDLVDLDLDTRDYEYLQEDEDTELEQKYKEILNKPIDESLIEQMTHTAFEPMLKQWLV